MVFQSWSGNYGFTGYGNIAPVQMEYNRGLLAVDGGVLCKIPHEKAVRLATECVTYSTLSPLQHNDCRVFLVCLQTISAVCFHSEQYA